MESERTYDEDDWKGVVENCDALLDDIDQIPERGREFAEEVLEKVEDIRAWIEEHEHCTEKQACALTNIDGAGLRWLHRS